MHRLVLTAVCFAALASHTSARADEPLWELGLGAGWLQLPHYRGSDQQHQWLLPVPFAVYRGKIFRANRDGARAVLLDSDKLDVDVSLALSAPIRSTGNRARAGMPDLAPALELGPNVNINLARGLNGGVPWKVDLRLPVHAVVTLERGAQGIGYTANAVLNLDMQWQGWNVGVQGSALYGSRQYHQYFYSVDPAYATTTRSSFRADGGFAGSRFTIGASRRFGNTWIGTFVRADNLSGAAFRASPLVRQTNTVSAGLALSWVLATSNERVNIDD